MDLEFPNSDIISQTLKRSFQELIDNFAKDSSPLSKRPNVTESQVDTIRVEVSKVTDPKVPPPEQPKRTYEEPRTDIIRVEVSKVIFCNVSQLKLSNFVV